MDRITGFGELSLLEKEKPQKEKTTNIRKRETSERENYKHQKKKTTNVEQGKLVKVEQRKPQKKKTANIEKKIHKCRKNLQAWKRKLQIS